MIHTIRDLKKRLQENKKAPVYLLFGDEAFLTKASLRLITENTLPGEGQKDFNHHVFDLSAAKAQLIQETIETLPVFCERRLVICRLPRTLQEKDLKPLIPVIEKPVSTTVLVLLSDTLDKRKKIFQFLIKNSFVVENKQPSARELPQWLRWLAQSLNLSLSEGAVRHLIHLAGPSLMSLRSELQKIKTFIGDKKTADSDDVLQVVSRTKPENVFAFTEAIANRDVKKSFHCLIHLMEDEQSEAGLIALLTRHVRILAEIADALTRKLSPSQMSSQTGVPVFFIKDYVRQLKSWDHQKLARVIEVLHATDKAVKSSPVSSDIWMENFVFKACSL